MVASPAVWMTVAGELGVDVHTLQNLSGPHGEVPLKELRFGSPSLQNDKAKAKLLRVMAERRLTSLRLTTFVELACWDVHLTHFLRTYTPATTDHANPWRTDLDPAQAHSR